MTKQPNSKANLDRAIQRIYGTGAKYVEIRSMIANTVVGQFLPDGVVKGGSALRFRYGLENTRVTVDFDTAHRNRLEDFIDTIASGLRVGWSGFSGDVVRREPASPRDISNLFPHALQRMIRPFDRCHQTDTPRSVAMARRTSSVEWTRPAATSCSPL